jgi:hypothetical protein
MFKIIVILAICAAGGYVYKKGYVTQWVAETQQDIATKIQEAAPRNPPSTTNNPQWEERMRQQREHADRVMGEAQARIAAEGSSPSADPCARARKNVQEAQIWMREGGSMQNVTQGKKMSENETFDNLAKSRQYIESNCR